MFPSLWIIMPLVWPSKSGWNLLAKKRVDTYPQSTHFECKVCFAQEKVSVTSLRLFSSPVTSILVNHAVPLNFLMNHGSFQICYSLRLLTLPKCILYITIISISCEVIISHICYYISFPKSSCISPWFISLILITRCSNPFIKSFGYRFDLFGSSYI